MRGLEGVNSGLFGLFDPSRALFASLEVLCSTKFGSKHLILVQLAYLYREGISDPLVDLWGPPGDSKMSIYEQIKPFRRPK